MRQLLAHQKFYLVGFNDAPLHSMQSWQETMAAACGHHSDCMLLLLLLLRMLMTHDGVFYWTQVWKSITSLGCGSSPCSGSPMYVCQYFPPGNIAGQYTQNVFPPTS